MLRSLVTVFASRPSMTLTLWVGAVAFGVISYTSLLPREGFPSIDVPIAVASGAYLVDDPELVDAEVAEPLASAVLAQPKVEGVQSFSRASSFSVIAAFDTEVTSLEGTEIINEAIATLDLPEEAIVAVDPVNASRFLNEFELLVGVYGDVNASADELETAAGGIVGALEAEAEIERVEVVELISRGVNPATGEDMTVESGFNLLTAPTAEGLEFRPSIAIGVVAAEGVDSLAVRDAADRGLATVEAQELLEPGYEAVVAIDFATQIRQQIGSLQSNVLTGLIAVAIVALLLISWRASIVTALFIVTVLATTVGVLYLVGISLNTVSLFGVILALGLFVDDAIVITESIVANKRQGVDDLSIIRSAIGRVGSASVSGTMTTILVFAPMLTISGILGDFIRILPISVIVALSVSLILSFVFIPVASRYLILSTEKDGGLLTGVENSVATFIAELPGASGRQRVVRIFLAVGLSVAMTGVGLFVFAPRVGFNIFPPQKDSTEIAVNITYHPGTSIAEAKEIALDINQQAAEALGAEITMGYTYQGNERGTLGQLSLTDMGDRPAAPDLVEDTLQPLADSYGQARVTFAQVSAGPPEATFPFQAQVYGDDIETLAAAGAAIAAELEGATIERPNGTTFDVVETSVAFGDIVARVDGRRLVEVRARFDATDVSTTTAQTQTYVEDRFDADRLTSLGLASDALEFDFGFESDNQESFSSLPIAFGIALLSMLVLLVVQFRSASQWLLVFLAIPFSFFGVFGGLLATSNVISFFVMLGLIGLIGIAVNNTILLVDFANQERRAGHDRSEAIQRAVHHRFRPLVATSLTTVAGLLPLALSDPFWEALGMTIIFGLLSSTFLVLVSFPFYYLAVEALRDRFVTPWRPTSMRAPDVNDADDNDYERVFVG
ncbi:MAG: efflux RND transporter permease subunit [Actinomycetia bacterium]|nr:efflux RND transporter permease subunit [Actinomycetes bacterium]